MDLKGKMMKNLMNEIEEKKIKILIRENSNSGKENEIREEKKSKLSVFRSKCWIKAKFVKLKSEIVTKPEFVIVKNAIYISFHVVNIKKTWKKSKWKSFTNWFQFPGLLHVGNVKLQWFPWKIERM